MKLHSKIIKSFEDHLDIRSFVSMHNNLALLLKILFSKEQLILFKHHHAFTIAKKRRKQSKELDSSVNDHALPKLRLSDDVNDTKKLK